MSSSNVTSYYANYHPKGKAPENIDKNVVQTLTDFHMVARDGSWTLFLDILRQLQWGIIKALAWCADSISMASTGVLHFLSFYTYQPVINFLAQYQVYIILASFIFFGIAWIAAMSKKEIPIIDMIKSGAFAWFTFFVLPVLMMVATGAVQNLSQAISTHNTPSSTILKNNIVDVRALDSAHWDLTAINKIQEEGNGAPNFINTQKNKNGDLTVDWDELNYIDPTARLLNDDEGKLSAYGQKVISNRLSYNQYKYTSQETGEYSQDKKLKPLSNNMFKEDGHYYTYYWNFWTIVISYLASIIFTGILLLRMVRLETNIFLSWSVGNAISLSQWSTTKRNWEILSKIGMGFTTLLFTQALGVLFNLGLSQLTAMLQSGSINFVEFVVLIFGFGMEMIDGPSLWQQLFGIDAGIKSGWQNLWGGVMLAKSLNDSFNPLSNQRRLRRAMEGNNKKKNNKQTDDSQENPEQKESKFKNFFKGADSKSQNENPEDSKSEQQEQRQNKGNPKDSTQQKEGQQEEQADSKAETKANPSSEHRSPEEEKQEEQVNLKSETKVNSSSPSDADFSEPEEKREHPEARQQPKESAKNNWESNNNPFEENYSEMSDYWENIEPPQENPEYHI